MYHHYEKLTTIPETTDGFLVFQQLYAKHVSRRVKRSERQFVYLFDQRNHLPAKNFTKRAAGLLRRKIQEIESCLANEISLERIVHRKKRRRTSKIPIYEYYRLRAHLRIADSYAGHSVGWPSVSVELRLIEDNIINSRMKANVDIYRSDNFGKLISILTYFRSAARATDYNLLDSSKHWPNAVTDPEVACRFAAFLIDKYTLQLLEELWRLVEQGYSPGLIELYYWKVINHPTSVSLSEILTALKKTFENLPYLFSLFTPDWQLSHVGDVFTFSVVNSNAVNARDWRQVEHLYTEWRSSHGHRVRGWGMHTRVRRDIKSRNIIILHLMEKALSGGVTVEDASKQVADQLIAAGQSLSSDSVKKIYYKSKK